MNLVPFLLFTYFSADGDESAFWGTTLTSIVIPNCKKPNKVQKTYKYLLIAGGLFVFFLWSYKGIKHFVSPHYLDNEAVKIYEQQYSPDSSISVVYYTLDVGARGIRTYKTLLRASDYSGNLMTYNLPPDIVVEKWLDNKTLLAKYDPNESLRQGGLLTDLDLTKDTLTRNGVTLIVKERLKKESFIP